MSEPIATFYHYDFATTHPLSLNEQNQIVKYIAAFAERSENNARFRGAASFGQTREEPLYNFAIPVTPGREGEMPRVPAAGGDITRLSSIPGVTA